jgi:ATP-dependent Clp protease adaptor protein ClpS
MTTDTVIEKKTTTTTNRKVKEPSKYKVIVCNDDVTPVEFVVAMLVSVFNHEERQALNLTLAVHNKGSAVAGVYSYEIAEQKVLDATNMARLNGYPLVTKMEAE